MVDTKFDMISAIDNVIAHHNFSVQKHKLPDTLAAVNYKNIFIVDSVYYTMNEEDYEMFRSVFPLHLKLRHGSHCKFIYHKYGHKIGQYKLCDGYVEFYSLDKCEIDCIERLLRHIGPLKFNPHKCLINNYDFASYLLDTKK